MGISKSVSSGYAHPSTRYWIELIIEEKSVDQETNTSEIFFDLRARSEVTWDLEFSDRLGYIKVNGQQVVSSYTNLGAWDGDGGKYNKRICSTTKSIKHNEDGTLNLEVEGYYDYSGILISRKWWLSPVRVSTTFVTTPIANKPSLKLSVSSQQIEQVSIGWSTNISVSKIEIYDDQNRLIKSENVGSKKAGSVNIGGLTANTQYKYNVRVQSVGGVWSDIKPINIRTTGAAAFASELEAIFGDDITIVKTNTSTLTDDLYFYMNGKFICKREKISNVYTLHFSQEELDTMYKLFGFSDTAQIKAVIITNGASTSYETSREGFMTLTGNAKTVKIGDASRIPLRAKVFYAAESKVPKRAVVWVGNSNKVPKRTI